MMAIPLITTLGGTCCRPSALRNRLNTTTIFVNEVTITATNGASARPTTVTRITPGLRLPKSIGLERKQLHAQHISQRRELSKRQREISEVEVETDGDVIRRACGLWVRHG